MENNLSVILKNAEEKINSNEWSSALDILGDIDCNDCSYDEIEQILWLKIDCWSLAAARICVMEFSPEEMDDNFNNITDIISNLIVKLFVNICLNEKQNRAGEFYIKFYNILEDRFISVLDEAISEITSVKASGLFFIFTTRHAVFCAGLKIVFLCAAEESEIPTIKLKISHVKSTKFSVKNNLTMLYLLHTKSQSLYRIFPMLIILRILMHHK